MSETWSRPCRASWAWPSAPAVCWRACSPANESDWVWRQEGSSVWGCALVCAACCQPPVQAEGFLASRDGKTLYAVNCLALAIGGIGGFLSGAAAGVDSARHPRPNGADSWAPGTPQRSCQAWLALSFQLLRIIGVPSVRIWLVCAAFALLLLPLLVLVVRSLQRHHLAEGWTVPLTDRVSSDPANPSQSEPV